MVRTCAPENPFLPVFRPHHGFRPAPDGASTMRNYTSENDERAGQPDYRTALPGSSYLPLLWAEREVADFVAGPASGGLTATCATSRSVTIWTC